MSRARIGAMAGTMAWVIAPLVIVVFSTWGTFTRFAMGDKASAAREVEDANRITPVPADEWPVAGVELQALTDATLACGPEEMPAYWRLLKWTVQPASTDLPADAFPRIAYSQLVNSPHRLRGRPVQLDLHVCRILSYDAPDNVLGIRRLFEVWGWTEDSRGSLCVVVSPELPPGVETGESVDERLMARGYFCKIQGYLTVGSAPQSFPSTAPLVIGQLSQVQPAEVPVVTRREFMHGAAGVLLASSLVGTFLWRSTSRRRRADSAERQALKDAALDAWLGKEESADAAERTVSEAEWRDQTRQLLLETADRGCAVSRSV